MPTFIYSNGGYLNYAETDVLQIVGNERSKRYYRPTDKGYKRALRQKNLIFFASEEDAIKAGYIAFYFPKTSIGQTSPNKGRSANIKPAIPDPPFDQHVIPSVRVPESQRRSARVDMNHLDDKES